MNYNLDETFPFDKITLANPSSLQVKAALIFLK